MEMGRARGNSPVIDTCISILPSGMEAGLNSIPSGMQSCVSTSHSSSPSFRVKPILSSSKFKPGVLTSDGLFFCGPPPESPEIPTTPVVNSSSSS